MLVEAAYTQLLDAVREAINGLEIRHVISAFNDDAAESEIDDLDISGINVVALGEQDCTVTFDVRVDFTTTLHWIDPDSEYSSGDPDEPPYVTEHQRIRSKEVSDFADITATAKIRFSEDHSTVDKIVFVDLDENELVMTEKPWVY